MRRGFTLVEMSVVLIIIGLIATAVFPALLAWRKATSVSTTQAHLDALLRASAAYVQANGCLPCPTPVGTSGSGFGMVRGDAGTSVSACGACATYEGLPPFASLGLPPDTAQDGWKRWIRMRVDPALTIAFGVVPPTLACTSTDGCTTGTSAKGLCKTGLAATNRIKITQASTGTTQLAAILFLSHGANGYGAPIVRTISNGSTTTQYPFPSSVLTCANGGFEACNANAAGALTRPSFYDAPAVASTTEPFDDLLVYRDRNSLVSMLSQGACQTTW